MSTTVITVPREKLTFGESGDASVEASDLGIVAGDRWPNTLIIEVPLPSGGRGELALADAGEPVPRWGVLRSGVPRARGRGPGGDPQRLKVGLQLRAVP
jgi:hypothetical protein